MINKSDPTIQLADRMEFIKEIPISNFHQKNERTNKFSDSTIKKFSPSDLIYSIAPSMPENLISNQNLFEIKKLSDYFVEDLTSFQIFESRLNSYDNQSDYCFAISSKNGEREVLLDLLNKGKLPKRFLKNSAWKNLREFTKEWIKPNSILYENIIGLWFEFDTASNIPETPIPSFFIQPKSNYVITGDLASQHYWITKFSMQLLKGKPLSLNVEKKINECLTKLPGESSLFQIGTMLSRNDDEIRIVIKRIRPEEIIPYLESIGWSDNEKEELSTILEDIKNIITRFVLHISVGEHINPKIGIECSFYPDKYHQEHRWEKFLDYLQDKKLCNNDKYSALLEFSGIDPQDYNKHFNSSDFMPSVMLPNEKTNTALIRYISHIKLVYNPNKTLIAKAYPAVRLFGQFNNEISQTTTLFKNK